MIRQHELDLARRAEEERASLAAIDAMQLSEDVPSSDPAHAAASVTSIPRERFGTTVATATTMLPYAAPAAAAAASPQDLQSPQDSAASFMALPTPAGDIHASSPNPVASFPGETESLTCSGTLWGTSVRKG
jgi:hypothetical protein